MIIENKIFLKKSRNFAEIFNTTFALVRANFKVIAGAFLMLGGPFILLTAVVSAFLQATVMRDLKDFSQVVLRDEVSQYLSDVILQHSVWFILIWIFGILSFSFVRATLVNFFVIYDSKYNGDEITSSEIASKSLKDGLRIFGGILMLSVLLVIPLGIVAGLIAFSANLFNYGGIVAVVLLVLFFLLILIAFGPQLSYLLSYSVWFSMIRDNLSLFQGIKKSLQVIKGKFWFTWALMVAMIFIVTILNYVVSLPATVYYQISVFTRSGLEGGQISFIYVILFVIAQFGSSLFQCLIDMMVHVSYYSFEEEKLGIGIQSRIDEIGKENELQD